MTNITWNDADLYAYLDGEMNAERSEALESELANNVTLQQRLDKLRLTLAFVQEVPLREEPRNYILTPSMVEEPEPEPATRRPLLFAMRLATTLSALAFVVMVGLQVNVSLTPQPAAAPHEEILMLEREQPKEENTAAVEEEAPVEVMEAPQEAAEVAATPTAAAEMAAVEEADRASEEKTGGGAPTWDDGEGEIGGQQGLGGDESPLEPEIEEAPPDEDIGICGVDDTSEECAGDVEDAPEVLAEEATGSEVEPVPTVVAEATEEAVPAEAVSARSRPTWQLWLAIAFGISTVVLGLVTWWLTSRR